MFKPTFLVLWFFTAALILFTTFSVSEPEQPPVASLVGCGPRVSTKDVTDATLSVKDIGCVFTSKLVDPSAVAKACGITDALIPLLVPVIRGLIGQREAARTIGVQWYSADTLDASADSSADAH